jgi:hypothetical protein
VAPQPGRRPPGRAAQVRRRQALQGPVVAQPGDVRRAARLQPGEQRLVREARVQADQGDLAQACLDPVDQVEDEGERALGGVRVARAQPGIEQVAGLRRAGDQGMVHRW